jgi:hypothetical protein
MSENFTDYISLWKHNGHWFFDSPQIIKEIAREHVIDIQGASLFYYEMYEKEFDGTSWLDLPADASSVTKVLRPENKQLEGFDVVSFYAKTSPECSPLSCNSLAEGLPTNEHCLFESFENAEKALNEGSFENAEPGPYRIFAVYSVMWS